MSPPFGPELAHKRAERREVDCLQERRVVVLVEKLFLEWGYPSQLRRQDGQRWRDFEDSSIKLFRRLFT